ncbi:ATP-dependent RNA helicase DDX24 isoform 1 [Schistosoma japonicum]|uniref:RNA helicase n=1 Tax=Schistosoma japonicum TaxID=6182 RepID=A0A4Z2CLI6_SCHJA|nr:ATP-dependent RNA helicase DDX24 isoform 1 [Schistosoma japonicum]
MTNWESLKLPEYIVKALSDCNLQSPTPIQVKAIPPALHDSFDILGSAPTGSGKTLAFGIPLITKIFRIKRLENQTCDEESTTSQREHERSEVTVHTKPFGKKRKKKDEAKIYSDLDFIEELDVDTGEVRAVHSLSSPVKADNKTLPSVKLPCLARNSNGNRVYGLVLVPTRELAIQVSQHIRALTRYIDCIRIETIVGGISVDKQLRLLQALSRYTCSYSRKIVAFYSAS